MSLGASLVLLLPASQAQFVNFEDTWREFLGNNKTSNISKLTKPSKDQVIDYSKYCLMYANTYFCSGEIGDSEDQMAEIKKIGESHYGQIPGFKEKYEDLGNKITAYHQVDRQWKRFLVGREITLADLDIAHATQVCEKGTLAKHSYMLSRVHYCQGSLDQSKDYFQNRVLKLVERTSLELKDVEGLEAEVNKSKELFQGLSLLDKAWAEYIKTDVSPGFKGELPLIRCNSLASIKAYLLQAAADLCKQGREQLKKIKKLQASNTHPIPDDVSEKLQWLETEVGKYTGDEAVLNEAWEEFVATDTLEGELAFGYEYCRLEDQVKAYTMTGMVQICEQGEPMLKKIAGLLKEHQPEIGEDTETQLKKFVAKHKSYKMETTRLETLWEDFLASGDTILKPFELADFYCDKIAQVKSWTISGHFDPCDKGQQYLDQIDALQKEHDLSFGDDLDCRVQRLRGKVYQCRYWELVLQARKETHAERERFGPPSAQVMQGDLNSDQLPCETTVRYTPLGNIGIQYIISTYLCQDIDLAKMGDPEYYKKIATWVDGQVLQKYCEASLRCKEDFFIYLEGHTDGHVFKGARYKNSLDIPEGTAFTHFTEEEAVEKTTAREITNSLRSNMELGIARAWTVKNQLDFMQVPIRIGAYEHPASEKGGEYRRVEIELNITNLLLDFYEKRLQELIQSSGIGQRPEEC